MTEEERMKFTKAKLKSNKIGLKILKEILADGIVPEISANKGYDINLTREGVTVGYVETSFRNMSHNEYDYAIVTEGKVGRLFSMRVRSLYMCIFNDGHYYLWEAGKKSRETEEKFCPIATVIKTGMKTKKCYKFYLKDAYLKGRIELTNEERRKL